MNDTRALLVDAADRLFAAEVTRDVLDAAEAGNWPYGLWRRLDEAGLTRLAASEARGGANVVLGDQLAVIRRAAYHAAPVPLAETALAEQLLAAAQLPPIEGPLTTAQAFDGDRLVLRPCASGATLDGTLYRVPFARHATGVVAIAECEARPVTVVIRAPFAAQPGDSHANEPRDTLRMEGHQIDSTDHGAIGAGATPGELRLRGALLRAVQMVGAMQRMLEMTVRYSLDRRQFGRPIAKFQAVQHQIAMLASHAAAASAAAQGAIDASTEGPAAFEIAAAKARAGDAAALVIEFAHQVHGAIGFTRDHSLHFWTRRLWTWRDEFGSEAEWNARIGQAVARLGGEGLWPFLTAPATSPDFFDRELRR